jgi:hypothetical protein
MYLKQRVQVAHQENTTKVSGLFQWLFCVSSVLSFLSLVSDRQGGLFVTEAEGLDRPSGEHHESV